MGRRVNRTAAERADHTRLMLWSDIYRMPSGHIGVWQPPNLVTDRDHPFPRQMAPARTRWRDRMRDRIRRWRGAHDQGAVR